MSIETVTQENIAAGLKAAAAWRVRAVNVLPDYRLSITCNDGTNGIVDMSALVNSPDAGMYAELKDKELFQQQCAVDGRAASSQQTDIARWWICRCPHGH